MAVSSESIHPYSLFARLRALYSDSGSRQDLACHHRHLVDDPSTIKLLHVRILCAHLELDPDGECFVLTKIRPIDCPLHQPSARVGVRSEKVAGLESTGDTDEVYSDDSSEDEDEDEGKLHLASVSAFERARVLILFYV